MSPSALQGRLFHGLTALSLGACSATGVPGAGPAGGELPFQVSELATFDDPWALAFLPDGSALVTQKGGAIRQMRRDGTINTVAGGPQVVAGGQGGLLDVVLSPHFGKDHYVYLTFSAPVGDGSGLALARARLNGDRLSDLTMLWSDPEGGEGGQFGAIIAFAPDGNSLFLSSGERQRFTPAQDNNQPLGKILHLTLDGQPARANPFDGKFGSQAVTITDPPANTRAAADAHGERFEWPGTNRTPAEIWSLGHRNPYGLAFAPDGRLWETEMGPKGGDELNLIEAGKNYGWPLVSEGENYDSVPIPKPSTQPDFEPSKLSWVPSVSPTSLVFYSGALKPEWKGNAFIGSLSGRALIRVTVDGATATKADQWDMAMRIRFVTEGPDGALYLLEDGSRGRLLKLTPKR